MNELNEWMAGGIKRGRERYRVRGREGGGVGEACLGVKKYHLVIIINLRVDRPSVLMRSEVRTRAKSVALNMTVPSVFSGIFIDTNRYNTPQHVHFLGRYRAKKGKPFIRSMSKRR